ncbi:hypothetical protein [Peribacillus alkalitolerans]|uniref:hypothetical protein n=1 Tax=Peribacillus alkalitolerans TaxID=1550385 RepID=UPI0013D724D3|nr:hypothetical protein [Peribacillus alkalitolerans]
MLAFLAFLGFIVFLVMTAVALFKKNGKGKRNILISIACFVVFLVSVVSNSEDTNANEEKSEPKQEQKEKKKELDNLEKVRQAITTGMAFDEYQKAKKNLSVEVPKSISIGNGNVGTVLQAKDGLFVALTDGLTVLGVKEFTSMAEVDAYEKEALAKAEAEQKAKEEQERKAAAEKAAKEAAAKKANAKTIPYAQLEKNPDRYKDEYVKYTGQIVQIMEGDNLTQIRLAVTKDSYGYSISDIIFVEYTGLTDFVEDDIVTIYGTVYGKYSYTSQANYEISLPGIIADSVE